jgi:hypothetical protein
MRRVIGVDARHGCNGGARAASGVTPRIERQFVFEERPV